MSGDAAAAAGGTVQEKLAVFNHVFAMPNICAVMSVHHTRSLYNYQGLGKLLSEPYHSGGSHRLRGLMPTGSLIGPL